MHVCHLWEHGEVHLFGVSDVRVLCACARPRLVACGSVAMFTPAHWRSHCVCAAHWRSHGSLACAPLCVFWLGALGALLARRLALVRSFRPEPVLDAPARSSSRSARRSSSLGLAWICTSSSSSLAFCAACVGVFGVSASRTAATTIVPPSGFRTIFLPCAVPPSAHLFVVSESGTASWLKLQLPSSWNLHVPSVVGSKLRLHGNFFHFSFFFSHDSLLSSLPAPRPSSLRSSSRLCFKVRGSFSIWRAFSSSAPSPARSRSVSAAPSCVDVRCVLHQRDWSVGRRPRAVRDDLDDVVQLERVRVGRDRRLRLALTVVAELTDVVGQRDELVHDVPHWNGQRPVIRVGRDDCSDARNVRLNHFHDGIRARRGRHLDRDRRLAEGGGHEPEKTDGQDPVATGV